MYLLVIVWLLAVFVLLLTGFSLSVFPPIPVLSGKAFLDIWGGGREHAGEGSPIKGGVVPNCN